MLVARVVDVHCNQVVAKLLFFLVRKHVELLCRGDDALDVVNIAGCVNIHLQPSTHVNIEGLMERGYDEFCLISAEDTKYWHLVKRIGHRVDDLPLGVLICICPCEYLIFGEKQELIVIVSIKAEMRA